ncbi:MAG: HlyD family efflux transporter periplasmic adaptor subunit [Algicola sp.]|nr:HlyD family efflux transporter periplasmic adaptor subunit [Algicola sp.]
MFRQAVLNKEKDSAWGDIILLPPASLYISSVVVTVIVIVSLVFVSLNDYEKKQRAYGVLAPDKGLVKVFSPRNGFVKQLLIGKGDVVTQGQIVALVQAQSSDSEGRQTNVQLINEYKTQKTHLLAELGHVTKLSEFKKANLNLAISGTQSENKVLNSQLAIEQDKHLLADTRYQQKKTVGEQKYLSGDDLASAKQAVLSIAARVAQIQLQLTQQQNQLAANKMQLSQVDIKALESQLAIKLRLSELSQRIIQAQSEHSFTVKAPIAGTVSSLQIVQGNNITGQTPMLSIIPEGAVLEAKLMVPSRAIGFMAPGQMVRLRYDAFPFQRYGTYVGKVLTISKSTLSASELTLSLGVSEWPRQESEAVYLVDVRLQSPFVTAYGRDIDLQAGMSLNADIILEKRSLMQWLLDPLYSISGRIQ